MADASASVTASIKRYNLLLLLVAGLGGLLYGIDIGVIDPALRYLNNAISLSEQQLSYIVAAVLAGSVFGSVVAGFLADWLGRKIMMIISGLMFVASVFIIISSQAFVPLMLGRLLQGLSGGVIAVVVPLYLAECLSARNRGRGTGIFQFLLTIGILLAGIIGGYYTSRADTAIALAGADKELIKAASNTAWHGMFLTVVYPGILFLLGCFFVTESPRWLYRRGRKDSARTALLKSRMPEEADCELQEMSESLAHEHSKPKVSFLESLKEIFTQRKYVLPFIIACIILGCNQATGINSMLQYMTTILQQAGLDAVAAVDSSTLIKAVNCIMTVVAILLVERAGRKFLLKWGTGGIIVSLCVLSYVFYSVESQRIDVKADVKAKVTAEAVNFDLNTTVLPSAAAMAGKKSQLAVLFTVDGKPQPLSYIFTVSQEEQAAARKNLAEAEAALAAGKTGDNKSALESAWFKANATLKSTLARSVLDIKGKNIDIQRATLGPIPSRQNGIISAICIAIFMAFFAVGPGVCVWLALSELMPTRIRSAGMGIALLINQGVSASIAAVFLPMVGNHGYYAMFLFWAACTVIYFLTAAFLLPETKGKTLEEIEEHFEGKHK
jgi:sugar porter (SP) family MFS transporter